MEFVLQKIKLHGNLKGLYITEMEFHNYEMEFHLYEMEFHNKIYIFVWLLI